MTVRYYEDIDADAVYEFGPREVTEDAIVSFAKQFDPQTMHLEADAVPDGPIASGWHTCAVCMRLLVDGFLSETATLASPAVDELRWPTPVHPGDELTVRLDIMEKRPSESREDRGVLRTAIEATNQDDETVLTMEAIVLVGRSESDED